MTVYAGRDQLYFVPFQSLKFHVKTWEVPSKYPTVVFSVCLFTDFILTWNFNSLYGLKRLFSLKVLFHECDDMQIILMTSDTVATLNQSHTVITTRIVFKGYDTDAFFTVYVWFAEIKAILTKVCLITSSCCLDDRTHSEHSFPHGRAHIVLESWRMFQFFVSGLYLGKDELREFFWAIKTAVRPFEVRSCWWGI